MPFYSISVNLPKLLWHLMFNRSHTKIGLAIAALAFITALVINGFNNYTTAELCEKAQKNLRITEQQALDGLV